METFNPNLALPLQAQRDMVNAINDLRTGYDEVKTAADAALAAQAAAEAAAQAAVEAGEQTGMLKATVTGDVLSINDAAEGYDAIRLESTIMATQLGEGNPSPVNYRPIVGHTAVVLTRTDEEGEATTVSASLPETVYGGVIDWLTGVLTVTHAQEQLSGNFTNAVTSIQGYYGGVIAKTAMKHSTGDNGLCDKLTPVKRPTGTHVKGASINFGFDGAKQTIYVFIPDNLIAERTLDALNTYFDASPATIVYPLATPYTVQLTAQQLTMLHKQTITTSTGDTTVRYIVDLKSYIDQAIADKIGG